MTRITIRFTDEQEKIIKKKAKIKNMNTSDYIKSCLFNKNENKQVKINNEENKNNLDDINNKILKVNTNVIKSHNILDSNLSKIEMQINTLVYFILLIIQLFKPNNFDEAKKMLSKAKNIAKIEQQEEANKK